MPISCIILSNDGKIYATCWDGNVYMLNEPKIDGYTKFDEENRDQIFDHFFPKE